VLIPDGRVTGEGLEALVAATDCKAWVYAEDDVAGPLIEARPGLQTLALPSLTWCLNGSKQGRYPYDRTFEEAAHDEIIIIHTSGTTGKF
jgi:acyl-coenzyme A synthetase/AMP-(fatty) acid ligase